MEKLFWAGIFTCLMILNVQAQSVFDENFADSQPLEEYFAADKANYNKSIISLSEILELFFENHDYSVVYPKRYASVIYYTEDEQREESEYYMKHYLVMSYAWHELFRVDILQQK